MIEVEHIQQVHSALSTHRKGVPVAVTSRMLTRLRAARSTVAKLVIGDGTYAPIFERLDAEIASEEAKLGYGDIIFKARAIIAARQPTRTS